MKGRRKRGRPRKTWRSQVEKESKSVGLKMEDAKNRARWRVPPLFTGIKPDENWIDDYDTNL
mgnify:CR=1 FL=1